MTEITHTTRNGVAFHAADWRRELLDAALRRRAADGSAELILLADLLRRCPQKHVRRFAEERNPLIAGLHRRFAPVETLVEPAWRQECDEPALPIFGWWRFNDPDRGAGYELVLAPDLWGAGEWLVIGDDTAATAETVATLQQEAQTLTCRFATFRGGEWHESPELAHEVERVGWDEIVLPPQLKSDVRSNVEAFFAGRERYEELGFAWRRGILLIGPPGTGKTLLCKAVARACPQVPFLYVRDLRHNSDLSSVFARARRCAPCVLAFEDIDGLMNEGSRSLLLNEIDGFQNNAGILLIASSNHPDKIDEALLKRPSRFDRVYHVGLPEREERETLARRLLASHTGLLGDEDPQALAAAIAEATEGFTPAFLKEAFVAAALLRAHEANPAGRTLGEDILAQVETLRAYLKKVKRPEALAEFAPSAGIGLRAR